MTNRVPWNPPCGPKNPGNPHGTAQTTPARQPAIPATFLLFSLDRTPRLDVFSPALPGGYARGALIFDW